AEPRGDRRAGGHGGHVTGHGVVADAGQRLPPEVVPGDALPAPGARVRGWAVRLVAERLEGRHLTGDRPGLAVAAPVADRQRVQVPAGRLRLTVEGDRVQGDVGVLLGDAQRVAHHLELEELVERAAVGRYPRLAGHSVVADDAYRHGRT